MATVTDRSVWLAERKKSIGASEAAAAIGLSPWKSPVELWMEKTGRAKPQRPTWRMKAGLALENPILDEYEETTGNKLVARQVFLHDPDCPFLTATPDGITEDGIPVDAKTANSSEDWGEEGSGDVPDAYQIQTMIQMKLAASMVAHVPVLFHLDRVAVYYPTQDLDALAAAMPILDRFWWHVTHDTPPDWGRLDARALAILHPTCEGEINIPWAVENDVREYESLGETIKAKEERHEALKVAILAAMGTAKTGQLSDGRQLRRYLSEIAEKEIKYTRAAYTSHYFRITKGR